MFTCLQPVVEGEDIIIHSNFVEDRGNNVRYEVWWVNDINHPEKSNLYVEVKDGKIQAEFYEIEKPKMKTSALMKTWIKWALMLNKGHMLPWNP